MSQLTGQTAVVTGSSSGIGRAIARRFAREGANVVVNSRSAERANSAAEEIDESSEGSAVGVAADVSEYEEVEELTESAVDEFGRLDVMVNNAGITKIGPAVELDPEEWQEVIDVDLTGVFFGAQVAARRMIEAGEGGAILNVSSIMGEKGLKLRAPYCAAKGAVNNLTRTLAVEWAEHGITVNALAPGYVRTEMTGGAQTATGYTDTDIEKRTPMARYGTVEEMAECGLFLVSRENFVTGEVLDADGGWTADAWRYWADRGD